MKKNTLILFIVGVVLIGGVAFYYLRSPNVEVAAEVHTPLPPAAQSRAASYPVADTEESSQAQEPAPGVDETFLQALGHVVDSQVLASLFNVDGLVRRFVVTTANATEEQLPKQSSVFKPLDSPFAIEEGADGPTMSTQNYVRYSKYVDLLKRVDKPKLVRVYARYYRLFQAAYKEFGTDGDFNDRLVATLDDALATPEVAAPVKLKKDGYYKFADPHLESLTAAQKIMLRIGPANAKEVKTELRQIRRMLTHLNEKS